MSIKAAACMALMLVVLFASACPKSSTLLEQSRKPGDGKLKPIEPAPGSYLCRTLRFGGQGRRARQSRR